MNGMLPRISLRAIRWTRADQIYSLNFQELGPAIWAFLRTWNGDNMRCVAIGVLDRFDTNATRELCVVGSVVAAMSSSASAVAIFRSSHILEETYVDDLGREYKRKLVDYAIFVWRLLKRYLQEVASSVFGGSDPFSVTELIVTRLKGAEHRDWMMSRFSLRRAIITNELQMPSLVEVVANIVGDWPLTVSYLKEVGKETDGDS